MGHGVSRASALVEKAERPSKVSTRIRTSVVAVCGAPVALCSGQPLVFSTLFLFLSYGGGCIMVSFDGFN